MIAGNLVLALGVNILMFIALPLVITRLIQAQVGFQSSLLFNGIDGLFRVLVFVIFLYSVSLDEGYESRFSISRRRAQDRLQF